MKLNKLLALLLALVMVFSFAACGGNDSPAPSNSGDGVSDGGNESQNSEGRVLNVHITAALESIDPAFTSAGDDFEVIGQMVEGLFRADASGAAVPGIAESCDKSGDGMTWTFHLRESYWSNGAKVTADDFIYA